ncbi:MAG: hypothetical protein GF333_05210 [Candidatus Omnitrophica bacterium]|nr:hypothetical protein [Candidatus Omnitrophota bacterium]
MKSVAMKYTQEKAGGKMQMLPHAFNYMLKEEILQRAAEVNSERVRRLKRRLVARKVRLASSLVAKKIMEGV